MQAILPELIPQLAAVVELLWWTGARPSKILGLPTGDIGRSGLTGGAPAPLGAGAGNGTGSGGWIGRSRIFEAEEEPPGIVTVDTLVTERRALLSRDAVLTADLARPGMTLSRATTATARSRSWAPGRRWPTPSRWW